MPVRRLTFMSLLIGALLMTTTAGLASDADSHELKNPDGSWKYTNALAKESSPYLLQHAHNPVNWNAWGPQAFDLARKTGKPIFLSIGYSTCYWCHVMERESFEKPEIAAQMNERFISIKVDREERPDVDDIYMAATQIYSQITTGRSQGGWPMSVFLTPPGADGPDDPGLKPFFAGTYFPPKAQYGRPGFTDLLEHLHRAWTEDRAKVLTAAGKITQHVMQHLRQASKREKPTLELVQNATQQLLDNYEPHHGGFGQAPKFPQPSNLSFLIAVQRSNANPRLWKALSHTFERMARGGMYDQIGGGFHRYSTDEKWLVPHFEKMLYDNGQLVEVYLAAQRIQPDAKDPALYDRVVRETCDYVLREMVDETGAFWSAQDAEVDAREGGSYIWTADEVQKVLADKKLTDMAMQMYGLFKGTNFQDPHHRDAPPANVLYLHWRLDELAQNRGESIDEVLAIKAQVDQSMLAARNKRKQPGTDDKVIVSWNGLMIAGMATAGKQLGESRYTDAAAKAADYILEHMRQGDGEDAGMYRTMRKGKAKIPAFLEDYAFFVHGLIGLHRATQVERYLDAAKTLTHAAQKRFDATKDYGGGYYDTLADQADLFVRVRSTYDGAIATGNSQTIHNLIDLSELTDDHAYLDRAAHDLSSFAAAMRDRGVGMVHMHHALLRALESDPGLFDRAGGAVTSQPAEMPDGQVVAIHVEPQAIELSSGIATLNVSLVIEDGYHINAHDPGQEWLIGTSIEADGDDGVTINARYPDGEKRTYAFSEVPLNVYEGTMQIPVTVTVTDDADRKSVKLQVTYQACTDAACLRPMQVAVRVQVK